jgi:hypothetical protein
MVQHAGEPCIPALGHATGVARSRFFSRIEVDVEVLGLEGPEVEAFVLNSVAAEILSLQRGRQECESKCEELKRESMAATG